MIQAKFNAKLVADQLMLMRGSPSTSKTAIVVELI